MKTIKILTIFNDYQEKGGESMAVEAISRYLSLQHQVIDYRVSSLAWSKQHDAKAPNSIQQLLAMWHNRKVMRELTVIQQQQQPQIWLIHNIYPVISPAVYSLAKKLGVKVIQYAHAYRPLSINATLRLHGKLDLRSLHGNYWPEIKAKSWQNSYLKSLCIGCLFYVTRRRKIYHQIDHWVAISSCVQQLFLQADITHDNVSALHYAWDLQQQTPLTLEQFQEEDYYLFLGRLTEEKGVLVLLEAWQKLWQKYGEKCPKLVIAGVGELANEVQRAVNKNNKIQQLSFVAGTEKQRLLRNCKALLGCSVWLEPLGLIVYEAFDFQKPVVVSDAGGISELVEENKTGWKYQSSSPVDLVAAIEKVEKQSKEQRFNIGTAGYHWLQEHTNPQRWLQQFNHILTKVLL